MLQFTMFATASPRYWYDVEVGRSFGNMQKTGDNPIQNVSLFQRQTKWKQMTFDLPRYFAFILKRFFCPVRNIFLLFWIYIIFWFG